MSLWEHRPGFYPNTVRERDPGRVGVAEGGECVKVVSVPGGREVRHGNALDLEEELDVGPAL